jgi:hypothetical protein
MPLVPPLPGPWRSAVIVAASGRLDQLWLIRDYFARSQGRCRSRDCRRGATPVAAHRRQSYPGERWRARLPKQSSRSASRSRCCSAGGSEDVPATVVNRSTSPRQPPEESTAAGTPGTCSDARRAAAGNRSGTTEENGTSPARVVLVVQNHISSTGTGRVDQAALPDNTATLITRLDAANRCFATHVARTRV